MSYYFHVQLHDIPFADAIEKTNEALAKEGFGILTRIDIQDTFKKKLGIDFPAYTILGACNPHFAHKALKLEDKIGTLLPCNVVIRETKDGTIEVAAVDPLTSMAGVHNQKLYSVASEVRQKLKRAIETMR